MTRTLTSLLLLILAACSAKQVASTSGSASQSANTRPNLSAGQSPVRATAPDPDAGIGLEGIPLRSHEFETVTTDSNGAVSDRRKARARYYVEEISGTRLEMVEVPAGTFSMGADPIQEAARYNEDKSDFSDEQPVHQVNVRSFYMGRFEVTQAQWRAVASLPMVNRELDPDPSHFKGDDLPVEQVSWKASVEFCARLSRATGKTYRLPSEAEWEYACRAGTNSEFAFGQSIAPELVNYNNAAQPYSPAPKGGRERTTPVGSLGVANAFGLYDMHGNVSEWCLDFAYNGDYVGAPKDGTDWKAPARIRKQKSDDLRFARGGSWTRSSEDCRTARRNHEEANRKSYSIGFRVVEQRRDPKYRYDATPLWTVSDKAKHAPDAFLAANKTYHLLSVEDIPKSITGYDIRPVDMPARAISEGDANGDGIDDALAIVVKGQGDHKLYSVICFNGIAGGGYNPAPFWIEKDSKDFIGKAFVAQTSVDRKDKYWTPPTIFDENDLEPQGEPADDDFYTWNGEQYERGYYAQGERLEIPLGIKIYSEPNPTSKVVKALGTEEAALLVLSSPPEKVKGVRWYKVQAFKNRTSTVLTGVIGFIAGDKVTRWAEEH
jgi:formylglycine-generating enzyme required for sulfatase activity